MGDLTMGSGWLYHRARRRLPWVLNKLTIDREGTYQCFGEPYHVHWISWQWVFKDLSKGPERPCLDSWRSLPRNLEDRTMGPRGQYHGVFGKIILGPRDSYHGSWRTLPWFLEVRTKWHGRGYHRSWRTLQSTLKEYTIVHERSYHAYWWTLPVALKDLQGREGSNHESWSTLPCDQDDLTMVIGRPYSW